MTFNFTEAPDRRESESMKWARYAGRDILPMWVADMDFAAPPAVIAALEQRVAHGVFGYGIEPPSLVSATVTYLQRRYGWKIESDWLVWLPGLVTGLNVMCRSVEGDVFTATPIYTPFMSAPQNWQRALTTQSLVDTSEGWRWDFAAVEAQLAASKAKLWLLCHPHNPVGRAWTSDELAEIARLARKYDMIVCSDEVHCDLLLDPNAKHTPFATLDSDAAARSITLMAPSKTYNIPGLGAAFAVIPDATLRNRFKQAMNGIVPHLNVLGLAATEAALTQCDDWLAALIEHLRGNAKHLQAEITRIPGLSMHPVEATYLGWINASGLCCEHAISNLQGFFEAAGVGLSAGKDFAPSTEGANPIENAVSTSSTFVRLNFGCTQTQLDEAITRIRAAVI